MWFGLTNKELVFYLFQHGSDEFKVLESVFPNIVEKKGTITNAHNNFDAVIKHLEAKTDSESIALLQDLEVLVQVNDALPTKMIKPRRFDIEKAKELYAITGRKGEELVNIYLQKLKNQHEIKGFKWMNEDKESGLPYDFEITNNDNSTVFSDAKTTSYIFEQNMIFSKNELAFINQCENYYIFRVFDLKETQPALRICKNIKNLSVKITQKTNNFENNLQNISVELNALKIAIRPIHHLLDFESKITLSV